MSATGFPRDVPIISLLRVWLPNMPGSWDAGEALWIRCSPLRFIDFLKAGIPITLVTTAVGVTLLWCFLVLGLF